MYDGKAALNIGSPFQKAVDLISGKHILEHHFRTHELLIGGGLYFTCRPQLFHLIYGVSIFLLNRHQHFFKFFFSFGHDFPPLFSDLVPKNHIIKDLKQLYLSDKIFLLFSFREKQDHPVTGISICTM